MFKLPNPWIMLLAGTLALTACGDDDDPDPVNEEEEITTVEATFNDGTRPAVVFTWTDLDGEGGNAPTTDSTGALINNTTYNVTLRFLNENEQVGDPEYNVTTEIEDEDDEHQVFFSSNPATAIDFQYADQDGKGNPVGLNATAVTGAAGPGTMMITLKHQPGIKTATTGINDGETDVEVELPFRIAE